MSLSGVSNAGAHFASLYGIHRQGPAVNEVPKDLRQSALDGFRKTG